jgi:serine/threonine-protein kinase
MVAEAAEGVAALRARLPQSGPKTGFLTGTPAPNIFITRSGEVKIKDGCLPLLDGKPLVDSASLPYLPHETPTGNDARVGRADAFTLGAILWELVAGRPLFAGGTDDETLRLVDAHVVPSLRAVARTPAVFDDVVERSLGGTAGGLRPFANAAEIANELRAALVAQGKRVSGSDISRTMGEMFAKRLEEEDARLERAWAEEQALQADGDLEPDSASETQVTLQNNDTVRDVTAETSSATFTRLRPRGVGFDELPTVPRNDDAPPSSEPLWRPSAPTVKMPMPTSPATQKLPAVEPRPKARPRPVLELSPQTQPVPLAPESEPLPPAPLPPRRSSPRALAPAQDSLAATPVQSPVLVLATPPRALVLPPVERGISQLGDPLPQPSRLPDETPLPEAPFQLRSSVPTPLPPTVKAAARPERVVATELVTKRKKGTSPLLVGAVAFGLSFLAIGIFGASRHVATNGQPAAIVAASSEAPPGGPKATPTPREIPTAGVVAHPSNDPWTTIAPPRAAPVPTTTLEALPAAHPASVGGTPPVAPSHAGPAPGRSGLLTVFCTPACDEVVDGSHSLGPSPVFKVPASVGTHRLRLKVASVEKRVTVTVTENETTVVREDVGD